MSDNKQKTDFLFSECVCVYVSLSLSRSLSLSLKVSEYGFEMEKIGPDLLKCQFSCCVASPNKKLFIYFKFILCKWSRPH